MQKCNHPPGFFSNHTGEAYGDDDCQINSFDIFPTSHYFSTTDSALDIEYNGPQVRISASFNRTCKSIPSRNGGNISGNTFFNCRRNPWYWSGTIFSKGHSFKSSTSIALIISYRDALTTLSFPFFTVQKKKALFSIALFPRSGLGGRISCSNVFLTW